MFYLNVSCIEYTLRIYIFLLHTLLLLVSKTVEGLQRILDHEILLRAGVKKIPWYMYNSTCGWCIVEKSKLFWKCENLDWYMQISFYESSNLQSFFLFFVFILFFFFDREKGTKVMTSSFLEFLFVKKINFG